MRVALLTTSWPRDEADASGRFLANQVERLRDAGVQIDIVAPRSAAGAGTGFRDYGIASGGGVIANLRRRPWLALPLVISMIRTLRRVARRADVVHANWLLTAPIAALARRPLVLTLHGSGTAGARFSDLGLAEHHPRIFGWLVRRASIITCVSEPLAAAARRAGAADVRVIAHGVDAPDAPRVEPAHPTLLFAGRLSHEKGLDVLLRARAHGHPEGDPADPVRSARLVVAGDGPEAHLLAADALVEHVGFVEHAALTRLYDAATLLVMPSRSEGFGVVALEAMARGVPVVASRVGGLAHLVEHERTGLLVDPDDYEALHVALARLLCDAALRARLGRNAQDRARTSYGWNHATRAMVDVYRAASARRA